MPQLDVMVEDPQEDDLFHFGCACRVIKTLEMPDGTITAILQACKRIELVAVLGYEPYITAKVSYREEVLADADTTDIKAISESLKDKAIQLMRSTNMGTRDTIGAVKLLTISDFWSISSPRP